MSDNFEEISLSPGPAECLRDMIGLFNAIPNDERPFVKYGLNLKIPRFKRQLCVDSLLPKYLAHLLQLCNITNDITAQKIVSEDQVLRHSAIKATLDHERCIYFESTGIPTYISNYLSTMIKEKYISNIDIQHLTLKYKKFSVDKELDTLYDDIKDCFGDDDDDDIIDNLVKIDNKKEVTDLSLLKVDNHIINDDKMKSFNDKHSFVDQNLLKINFKLIEDLNSNIEIKIEFILNGKPIKFNEDKKVSQSHHKRKRNGNIKTKYSKEKQSKINIDFERVKAKFKRLSKIEKNRENAMEYVKSTLKPWYTSKKINKDVYKKVAINVTEKILEICGEEDINTFLIDNSQKVSKYIKKYIHHYQKQL